MKIVFDNVVMDDLKDKEDLRAALELLLELPFLSSRPKVRYFLDASGTTRVRPQFKFKKRSERYPNQFKDWTDDETEQLFALVDAKRTFKQIGKELGRTECAVKWRFYTKRRELIKNIVQQNSSQDETLAG